MWGNFQLCESKPYIHLKSNVEIFGKPICPKLFNRLFISYQLWPIQSMVECNYFPYVQEQMRRKLLTYHKSLKMFKSIMFKSDNFTHRILTFRHKPDFFRRNKWAIYFVEQPFLEPLLQHLGTSILAIDVVVPSISQLCDIQQQIESVEKIWALVST
jgi:hypothetical protein